MDNRPYYRKLYADMIRNKYPDKYSQCSAFLEKKSWTALDVIEVNKLLFGSGKHKADNRMDQKHRAYDRESIKQILHYQQTNRLNNVQTASRFGLSRNTVAKWKRLFEE